MTLQNQGRFVYVPRGPVWVGAEVPSPGTLGSQVPGLIVGFAIGMIGTLATVAILGAAAKK